MSVTNALRQVNSIGDDLDGLIIDCYGTHAIIYTYHPKWLGQIDAITRLLVKHFNITYAILKDRTVSATSQKDKVTTRILLGKDSRAIVEEYGIKFAIDANDGLNAGLFLDMRANRHRVGQLCKGKRVLNCFSYTCAFGLHARMNGATEVVNVDVSRKYLDWGKSNYQLNSAMHGRGEFLCFNAVEFIEKAVKKDNRFDVIVIDPPSFARGEGSFQIKRDLPTLIGHAKKIMNPGGALFVATNYSLITHADLIKYVAPLKSKSLGQDTDFPGTNTFKESHLAAVLVS